LHALPTSHVFSHAAALFWFNRDNGDGTKEKFFRVKITKTAEKKEIGLRLSSGIEGLKVGPAFMPFSTPPPHFLTALPCPLPPTSLELVPHQPLANDCPFPRSCPFLTAPWRRYVPRLHSVNFALRMFLLTPGLHLSCRKPA
jgi:hypothetical protein